MNPNPVNRKCFDEDIFNPIDINARLFSQNICHDVDISNFMREQFSPFGGDYFILVHLNDFSRAAMFFTIASKAVSNSGALGTVDTELAHPCLRREVLISLIAIEIFFGS